jgi:uncharacterized membrane protein
LVASHYRIVPLKSPPQWVRGAEVGTILTIAYPFALYIVNLTIWFRFGKNRGCRRLAEFWFRVGCLVLSFSALVVSVRILYGL